VLEGGLSSDGAWLLLSSERFDAQCAGYPCLSVVDIDVTAGEAVLGPDGAPIRHGSGNGGAITRGGSAIAFGAEGVHVRDLHFTTRTETGWSTPIVLTADSTYAFNTMPRFDVNEQLLVFDCGEAPYGDLGTAICEVGIDGSGFRVVWTPDQVPTGGTDVGFLHHPSYTPDGGIVFEASWTGEQVWVLANGAAEPVLLRPDHNNDNAPCVLPDGRMVSLWLGRPGSAGLHPSVRHARRRCAHHCRHARDARDGRGVLARRQCVGLGRLRSAGANLGLDPLIADRLRRVHSGEGRPWTATE